MNDIASVIPAKWRDVGIQLGLKTGILDRIQSQNANCPDACLRCFEQVLTSWEQCSCSPYSWKTIIDALKTPSVHELSLAVDLCSKYNICHS